MSADSNTNPFGDPLKDPDTEQVADSAPSVTYLTVVLLMVFGLVLGVFATLGIQHITAPLPQALVAQVGTGNVLTAPKCTTGDHVYQATPNGSESKEVLNGKLVAGDLSITAKVNETGTLTVESKARDSKATPPIITAVYTWQAPVNTPPNTQLMHQVVRYAIPPKSGKVQLQPAKAAFDQTTIVFACVANEPR